MWSRSRRRPQSIYLLLKNKYWLGVLFCCCILIGGQQNICQYAALKSRSTENLEVRGPTAIYIWSVWIFAAFHLWSLADLFLDTALLFGFQSKLQGFLDSNLKLFCWILNISVYPNGRTRSHLFLYFAWFFFQIIFWGILRKKL